MELFLLLIPALFIPVGLSIAGIWWLLGNNEEDDSAEANDMDDIGGF